ncbi:50S ribosomal protein L9 [Rhodocaloribacter litoris]|uniref:50S ribosomal protein L9 n=1 Tax=Rhodocaloribacter litoris TaxID=2558931 RepID=UPI00141E9D00|nr:50S ribosomal protein L9 [Rhodocaloribacter litoris]QXD14483.1 50S ribosomal protein L9 [Rhodocaloribacter litoris]
MKVLLLQDVENLGNEGDIVTVKDGYGRNYLIPRGLARLATPSLVKAWKEERRQAARKLMQQKADAENLAAQLAEMEVVVPAKVGEENRIFGTVTAQQVADGLAKQGVQVDRRRITLDEDIRLIGVYTATLKLHPEVTATVKIRVVPEETEAEA